MSLIQRFSRNLHGRDFVVGDIHGHYRVLRQLLHHVEFHPSTDRLFSVGDLGDRGPESEQAVVWLAEDWFYAVRGNHEQMAVGVFEGRYGAINHLRNGGEWFLLLDDEDQLRVVDAYRQLPLAIEVDTLHGPVGIVHAEPASSWTEQAHMLDHPEAYSNTKMKALQEKLQWSRRRIVDPTNHRVLRPRKEWDATPVEGITRVYVGHSPMLGVTHLGNIVYIDTGMGSMQRGEEGYLTVIDLAKPDTHYHL